MSARIITFPGFQVKTGWDWADVTDAKKNEPFTLAKPKSPLGALQFSPAIYRKGPLPSPSLSDLLEMAEERGLQNHLGVPIDRKAEDDALKIAGVSYHNEGFFVKIWYVSDGANIMYITYVCDWDSRHIELGECETIEKASLLIRSDSASRKRTSRKGDVDTYRNKMSTSPFLNGIRGDLRTPDGSKVIARNVTPAEAFDALMKWFENLPKGK